MHGRKITCEEGVAGEGLGKRVMCATYVCVDGQEVRVHLSPMESRGQGRLGEGHRGQTVQRNCVLYQKDTHVLVSGVVFNRNVQTAVGGAEENKTLTFPRSVEHVGAGAFCGCRHLRRVILNEGLTTIGDAKGRGAFQNTALEKIALPATMKYLGCSSFRNCRRLGKVTFRGKCLESIGPKCFRNTAVAEVALPSSLRAVGDGAFGECASLQTVRVDGDFCLDVYGCVDLAVRVRPLPTLVGREQLSALRTLSAVCLPDGLERVGSYWFADSAVESVWIPTSVREIGGWAFCRC